MRAGKFFWPDGVTERMRLSSWFRGRCFRPMQSEKPIAKAGQGQVEYHRLYIPPHVAGF
jgi:hypothetical protein